MRALTIVTNDTFKVAPGFTSQTNAQLQNIYQCLAILLSIHFGEKQSQQKEVGSQVV